MYSNTAYLFDSIVAFNHARDAANDAYKSTMDKLERAKGSGYYDDERRKADNVRREAVDAARAECISKVNNALDCMKSAVKGHKITAPTAEQLATLQMLKMRDYISPGELAAAANAMNGNGSALAVVQQMADEQLRKQKDVPNMAANLKHYPTNYTALATDGMPIMAAEKALDELTGICRRIIHGSGADRAALLGAQYNARRNGGAVDEDSLPRERPYENERDFYTRWMPSVNYDSFAKTVNGDA